MRRVLILPVLTVLALVASTAVLGMPAASAQGSNGYPNSCAPNYIGPFASYSNGGWDCTGAIASGENSLGPLSSWDSWQVGDPTGTMFTYEACTWADSSTITWAIAIVQSSQSFAPTNWDVTTHDWAAGVYYQTGVTEADTQLGWSSIVGANGTCATSDAQGDSWGCAAGWYWTDHGPNQIQVEYPCNPYPSGSPQNPFPQLGYRGPVHPSPRASRVASDIRVITRRFESRGTKRIACPAGTTVIAADAALSNAAVADPTLPTADYTSRRATIVVPSISRRASVLAVVTCRVTTAGTRADGHGRRYGSEGNDLLGTGRAEEHAYGGGGDDAILVRSRGAIGSAGLGADTVRVTAVNGVAHGGPGDDALIGDAPGRVLLIGDSGYDTFTSLRGHVLINARDGSGDDTIVCGAAAHTRYLTDPGDVVRGTCRP